MKGKLLLFSALLICGVLCSQNRETCDKEIADLEDLNAVKYNKCLVNNFSAKNKDKQQIAERLKEQLHLKISSKRRRNRKSLRYAKKRKRAIQSIVNTNLASGVKSTSIPNEIIFALVDELPRFENCNDNSVQCFNEGLQRHFLDNFQYPKQAIKNKIEGRVFVRFVINKEGEVSEVLTKSSNNELILEEEVKRIVLNLPKLAPGKEFGQNIAVVYSMPIDFKL